MPVFCSLATNEITTVGEGPHPLMVCVARQWLADASVAISDSDPLCGVQLLVPRVGYLHQYKDIIASHFASYAPTVDGRLWFEENGTPVRWCRSSLCLLLAHLGASLLVGLLW